MRIDTTTLGSWVETHTEDTRGGRAVTIAVNRQNGTAVLLDDETPHRELHAQLAAGGFLADHPQIAPPPERGGFVRFLRTYDVHWSGADRYVAALDRRLAHRLWSARSMVVQVAIALSGLVAMIAAVRSGRPVELRPTAWDIPAYIALSLAAVIVHELGHALVLAHHGRRVKSVGFRLHLGSPAFYVDSIEALLLTRRQRVVQAAAGPWAEWQFVSLAALVLWIAPAGAWTPVLQRFVVLVGLTIVINLLPFSGLDGSLIFGDLIREPNLAADAKYAVRRVAIDRRPGDLLLVAYATVNALVSAALFATAVALWFVLFGGLLGSLSQHGVAGYVGGASILVISFGPALAGAAKHLRCLSPVDRILFRLERRERVRLTEELAAVAPFDQLDNHALGILAGQLKLRRIGRGSPLHDPGFCGYVMVDGRVDVAPSRPLGERVFFIEGPGLSATAARRLARVRAGLLPLSSLGLLGTTLDGAPVAH